MSAPSRCSVRTLVTGPFEENCHLLIGAEGCIALDPGADAPGIEEAIAGRPLAAILLTHGHADHLTALEALTARHAAPVYLHARDAAWAFTARNAIPPFYAAPAAAPGDLRLAGDGDVLSLAGLALRVIATPGHSPGGVCYWLEREGWIFTGDTLFRGTVGRTDLPGGDPRLLAASLARLAALPPATKVFPGHGEPTTLAEELEHNYFLAAAARRTS